MAITAAIIGGIIGYGGYSMVSEQRKAKREQEEELKRQRERMEQTAKTEEEDKEKAGLAARLKKQAALRRRGRQSTILTEPTLGTSGGKTVLG